jgi:hypothetical protein
MHRCTLPDSPLRVQADLFAAWTHFAFGRMQEFWDAAAVAMEQARRFTDPDATAFAILTSLAQGAPPELEQARATVAEEFATVPRAGIRPAALAQILINGWWVFLSAGRRDDADALRQELEDYARRVGDPYAQTMAMVAEVSALALAGDSPRESTLLNALPRARQALSH